MATQLVPLEDVQRLSPLVIRILGGNPGKFTLQGTNTYLIGTGPQRILIDTGEGLPTWATLLSHLLTSERATITLALLTHWHPDHTLGVPSLRALCPSVQIFKTPSAHDPPSPPYHPIAPNQLFTTEGATLRAFPCPGHTADHTALILEQESALFTGDAVLGHGTAVFEDLPAYMASLERMRGAFAGRAYPGHGAVVEDGRARIDEYIRHRRQREGEILLALRGGEGEGEGWGGEDGGGKGQAKSPRELVMVVYKDVPESLHEPAERGVVQVLGKLEGEGKVVQVGGGRWELAGKAAL